ncbi:MAG: hypothetical protein ACYTAN_06555 [Planctomycetota bacterium]
MKGEDMNVQAALKGQYHASLAMLKDTIDQCPDDLWDSGEHGVAFWLVVYHTLFYTHLYLMPDEKAFRAWEHHREEYQFLDAVPWPPHDPPKVGEPYTKAEVLEYWAVCDGMVDTAVDTLDLDAPKCGFPWYKLPKLDHQINNIRHIQHHAALLSGRLRAAVGADVEWRGFD